MQVQERQRKESVSKDATQPQIVKQEKKQLSKVENTVDVKKSGKNVFVTIEIQSFKKNCNTHPQII